VRLGRIIVFLVQDYLPEAYIKLRDWGPILMVNYWENKHREKYTLQLKSESLDLSDSKIQSRALNFATC